MMRLGVIDANDMLMEAELDTGVFHIGLSWNEEGRLWSLSIRDLNYSILASGIAAVPNFLLLRQVRRSEMPEGELLIDGAIGATLDRQSFVNGTAALYYLSALDLTLASL